MKKLRLFTLVAFAGLALTACGNASLPTSRYYSDEELANIDELVETPWTDYSVPATSVTFPEQDLDITLKKGQIYTYNPTVLPKEAGLSSLIWETSDEKIASINKGVVTAVGAGDAKIIVFSTAPGFNVKELRVHVDVDIRDFTVSPTSLELGFNEYKKLEVAYEPADTTQKGVTFTYGSEEDKNLIDISSDGTVTAKTTAGNATVKVTSEYINGFKSIPVVVKDKAVHVEEVKFSTPINNLEIGKTANVYASVTPSNATINTVTYSSSDPSVASISELGIIEALKVGDTTIRATADDNQNIYAEFDLHVYELVAASMEATPTSMNLGLNRYQQITLKYLDSDGHEMTPSVKNPTYVSSDSTIATVDSKGLVTGKNVGNTIINITDGDLHASVAVTVEIETMTITLTDLPDWILDGGCVVYAWVMGGAQAASWRSVSITGANGSFVAPADATSFLLARCAPGTVTPSWETGGNNPGRIYNQTEDMAINPGASSYRADAWKEYHDPTLPKEGFGLLFKDGSYLLGIFDEEKDPQGRDQYQILNAEFTAEQEFQIYNFEKNEGWTEAVEEASFYNKTHDYLRIGEKWYTALVDFTVDIYIKIALDNNSIYFGLKGVEPPTPPEPQEPEYRLYLKSASWSVDSSILLTQDATDTNKYSASNVALTANDEVKVHNKNASDPNQEWYGVAAPYSGCGWSVGAGGNAVIDVTGSYTVNFYLNSDNGNHIELKGNQQPEPPVTTAEYRVYGVGGSWDVANSVLMSKVSDKLYKAEGVELTTTDQIKVHNKNASANEEWYGVDHVYEGCGFIVGDDKNAKVAENGTYTVELHLEATDGNYLKLEKTGVEPPVQTEVTFSWTEEGIFASEPEIFAWVVNANEEGHWTTATRVGDKSAKVSANALTGMAKVVLATFASGTTSATVNWDNKLRQTEDIALTEGTYAYSNVEWKAGSVVPPVTETRDIYLNTNGKLDEADAVLFMHAWGGEEAVDAKFEAVADQTIIYKVTIPADETDYTIVRCAPGTETIIWDGESFWNKTADLKFAAFDLIEFEAYVENSNLFTVTNTANFDPTHTYVVDGGEPPVTETRDIYLNTKGALDEANAALFIHAWGGEEAADVKFTAVDNQTIIYKATIPADETDYVIVRCSTGAESIVWDNPGSNVWNQSEDSKFTEFDLIEFNEYIVDTNKFTITNTANFDPTHTYVVDGGEPPVTETRDIYLDAKGIINTDNATLFIHIWGGEGVDAADYQFELVSGDIYKVTIPAAAEHYVIYRCSSEATVETASSHVWNQTTDLNFTEYDLIVVTGWGDGNLFTVANTANYVPAN